MEKDRFAQEVTRCQEKLYRMAFCYVKNEGDALEIVSEAVYRAFLNRYQLKNPEHFDIWMCRIVLNCAIQFLKSRGRYTTLDDWPVGTPNQGGGLEAESRIDLYDALELLSDEEKSYVILKYFEGYSFREMAELLDTPENTVKTRVYRILAKLQRMLAKEGA